MQVWNQVLVQDESSEFNGRAGVVVAVEQRDGEAVNRVKLDDLGGNRPEVEADFSDAQLRFLC